MSDIVNRAGATPPAKVNRPPGSDELRGIIRDILNTGGAEISEVRIDAAIGLIRKASVTAFFHLSHVEQSRWLKLVESKDNAMADAVSITDGVRALLVSICTERGDA